MAIPEIHYARNGDVALAYQVLGDGPLDLVFLPAFINNIEIAWESPSYARFLRRLASFSRLIFMDRRGTGLSDRMSPTDLPPLEILMDDLVVVLDAVGSERVALFGSSNSGCLCAIFAATFPDRVSALALYGVAAAGVASDDFPWQWSIDEWDDYLRELAEGWGTHAYAEKIDPMFHPSLATTSVTSTGGRDSCDRPQAPTRSRRSSAYGNRSTSARSCRPSASRPSCSTRSTTGSRSSKQGATSPIGSRRRVSWSCREEMTNPGPASRIRSSKRSSSSSQGDGTSRTSTVCSRRSCLPTSSARLREPRLWGTVDGASS